MIKTPVHLIGMGVEGRRGLPKATQAAFLAMDELWGAERFFAEWPDFQGNKKPFEKALRQQIQQIKNRLPDTKIAILSSGDPNFFGISRLLGETLNPAEIVIHPAVSSLQVAFARVGIPWDDAVLTTLHTKNISELIGLAKRHRKIGVLTEPSHSPYWICRQLLQAKIPNCRVVICESLGSDEEKITDTRLASLEDRAYAPLNVLLLFPENSPSVYPSVRQDTAYDHARGLITKRDIRLLSLEHLAIAEQDTVWDIGSGSGAVSIEMAERAWKGQVFAIEKNELQLGLIESNRRKFGCSNLTIIPGEAPEALTGLPRPQAIFLGGSGGRLNEILDHLVSLKGLDCHLVANFAVIENLSRALSWFESHGLKAELSSVSLSYSQNIGKRTRLVPINPIFILNSHLINGGSA